MSLTDEKTQARLNYLELKIKGAERLADEVATLIRRGIVSSRSGAGDALLDYRYSVDPETPQSRRLTALEKRVEQAEYTSERFHRWNKVLRLYVKYWREMWKREYDDVVMITDEVSKVYYELTDGKFSKPNTKAEVILSEVERTTQNVIDEEVIHQLEARDTRIADLTVALGEAMTFIHQASRSDEGYRVLALCQEIFDGE